jgi:IS30 family transposase
MGVFMRQSFEHIDVSERDFIQQQVSLGRSLRSIAAEMGRPASTISREVARNRGDAGGYEAIGAGGAARGRRWRGLVKLREGSVLREHVITHIRKGWSPQQIYGTLAGMSEPFGSVSHETIYQMI